MSMIVIQSLSLKTCRPSWFLFSETNIFTLWRSLGTKRKKKGDPKSAKLNLSAVQKPEKEVSAKVKAWNEEQIAKTQNPPTIPNPHQGPLPPKLASTAAVVKAAIHQSKLENPPPVTTEARYTFLPQGTVVYHGTTLSHVQSILKDDCIKANSFELLDAVSYTPPAAVYIGGLFKALACSIKPALEKTNAKLEDVIPIVLELELQQDADICMDPDFFLSGKDTLLQVTRPFQEDEPTRRSFLTDLHLDGALAALSWSKFHSAGVPRNIPRSWVRQVYTPRLEPDGRLHPTALYFTSAALFLEFEKHRVPGSIQKWEPKFEASPLQSVDPDNLPIETLTLFEPKKVHDAVMAQYKKQIRLVPSCISRIQQAKGDPDLLDALSLKACQERTGTVDLIQQRINAIREAYVK